MNLVVLSPLWLVWLFAALLVVASIEDSIRLRISNILVMGALAAGLAAMAMAGLDIGLWQNFAIFAGFLVIGTPLFAAGKMGGGDVKLLAATGLWFDFRGALLMLISVLLAGGLLAIIILAARLFNWSDSTRERVLVLKRRGGIPYGVAISAGALLATALLRG